MIDKKQLKETIENYDRELLKLDILSKDQDNATKNLRLQERVCDDARRLIRSVLNREQGYDLTDGEIDMARQLL